MAAHPPSHRGQVLWPTTVSVGLLALIMVSPRLLASFSQFDGGIAASGATFTMHGLLPYRDYWLLYGPLSGYLLAIPTALFGPTIEALRIAGLVLVFAEAAIGYRLACRWTPRFPAAVIGIAAAILPAALLGIDLAAWNLAMALSLAGVYVATGTSRWTVIGGVLIGLAFMARLDVGAYALLACLVTRDRLRVAAGFGLVAVPFAALSLTTTPLADLIEQLIWFPLVGQRTFRDLPGLAAEVGESAALALSIPLVIIPRALIVASILRGIGRRPVERGLLALGIFALLCQLQTVGRTDMHHYTQAATPALLLVAAFLAPFRPRSAVVLAVPAALVFILAGIGLVGGYVNSTSDRDDDLVAATGFVRSVTSPDETIFVGLTSHRHAFNDPLIAYYLADRLPGTMHTLFNPGVTNTDATQRRIVRELRESGTRVLLLDSRYADAYEPANDSRIPGSRILDDHIAAEYALACTFGDYHLMVRRDSSVATAACPGSAATP
jgi:hypothetical protein